LILPNSGEGATPICLAFGLANVPGFPSNNRRCRHRHDFRLVIFQLGNDHLGFFGIGPRKGFGTVPKRLLGNPAQNGAKFFAAAAILEHAKDHAWLVKVTVAINHHWQRQNSCKKNCSPDGRSLLVLPVAANGQ